jgi:uncharacterized protein (DUF952 family)
MTFYHIILPSVWEQFQGQEEYVSETFEQEKFIHFSTDIQVQDTLTRYYDHVNEILILKIDGEPLKDKIKFELAPNGDEFPHLYAPLPIQQVKKVLRFTKKEGADWWIKLG